MIVKKHDSMHGSSGCYKCKKKKARWSVTMSLLEKYSMDAGFMVKLCDDCARLHEDQLRTFFLG